MDTKLKGEQLRMIREWLMKHYGERLDRLPVGWAFVTREAILSGQAPRAVYRITGRTYLEIAQEGE